MTNEEIRSKIVGTIYAHSDWFSHTSERDIIINSVNMIFVPERFASTRRPFRKAVRYIKSLKSQGHSVYVLSNWDAESFDEVQKRYPEIFGLFDGILISGNVHALKPTPSIYSKMLEQYGLDPEKSWFIDDQDDNIKAAQDLDINGIICTHSRVRKKPDFRQVRNDIRRCQCLNGDM
jgi:HAD superfamily hydrolase (TIGR01509 family)